MLQESQNSEAALQRRLEKLMSFEQKKIMYGVDLSRYLKNGNIPLFKEVFETANPWFSKLLKERSNGLTSNERLLCFLIALDKDNGEIASLLNIVRSSVVMAKYRMRKKLKLNEDETIEELVKGILKKSAEYGDN